MTELLPPTNGEAEQRLLGAFMCDNRLLDDAEILQPEHFANGLHARIFAAIRQVNGRGDVANIVTLRRIFDQDPALEEFGGGRYLVQLVAAGARTTIEVKGYARLVHDCFLRRELIRLTQEATAAAYREDLDNPPREQIELLESGLSRLAESGQAGAGFRSLSAMMGATLANAEEAYKRGDTMDGALTGFTDLDQVLGGLHPSDLVILAARPSMGKTALAENIARNAAKAGSAVCFYSLESRGNSSLPAHSPARPGSPRIGRGAPPISICTSTGWSKPNAASTLSSSGPMTRRHCRWRLCTRAPGD